MNSRTHRWGAGRPVSSLVCLAAGLMMFWVRPVPAQYNVFAWFNFDSGRLDPQAVRLGKNPGQRVSVWPYAQMSNAPKGFYDAVAAAENGSHGLMLKAVPGATPDDYLTGLASNIILERVRLGASGRALFQADFYIPPEPYPFPSLAVLAMEPLQGAQTIPVSFYRFGITNNRDIYFSHVIAGQEPAKVYVYDREMLKKLPRGAWHRFAIVCEGRSTIRCYIDGRELPFSPVYDSSLRNLQVGVLLADKDKTYDAFVDNLSIQWTNEDVPLPDSPWAHTWTGEAPRRLTVAPPSAAAPSPTAGAPAPGTPSAAAAGPLQWYDPETGWNQAVASGRPMLVYFLAPRVPATQQLDQMIESTPAAQEFLRRFTCVKVDVNQLRGGVYAQKFNIFKVPTLIVFDLQGREKARAVFSRRDTWADIEARLR